ncbi:MAG TPA: ParA family protein [Candidatus Polarisedimenticolaceae bacterium]|nr:ParA family protein [Candidatus Polarisedimenticolaceae bacterium]
MRVLAVYSIKGGVGKTATAVNLAYLSARAGARTLIWDLDPQAATTFYFRVAPKVSGGIRKLVRGKRAIDRLIRGTDYDGLDLLPADFSYRNLDLELDATRKPRSRLAKRIRPLRRRYDHLYIDCAPNISLASEGIFEAADALLVPIIPTTLSQRSLRQLLGHLDQQGPKRLSVLPFFCMVDRRKSLHRQICAADGGGSVRYLAARIPYSSEVERMGARRAPLATYAPACEAAQAYEALWREVLGHTGSWLGWFRTDRFGF